MGFMDKLREFFGGGGAAGSGGGAPDRNSIWLHFRCSRCGEVVRIRVDKRNDLLRGEDGPGTSLLRKEVMDNACFQLMRAEVWFDNGYNVVAHDVSGGTLISADEYAEATQEGEPE